MSRRIPGAEYLARKGETHSFSLDFTIEGVRVRESCGTKDRALAAAYALKRHGEEYRRIKLGEATRPDIGLADALERFYEEVGKGTAYGEGAQRDHMRAIQRHIPACNLAALDDAAIGRFVEAMRREKDRAPSTINRHLATLQAVCRRAREVWGVRVGPWSMARHRQREAEGREVFLEPTQATALMEAACDHLRPILFMACVTGMRSANVLGLRWEEISLDMGRAVLLQKGGRRLSVPLVKDAVDLLRRIQPDQEARRGPVFVFGNPAIACQCAACLSPANRGKPIRSVRTAFVTAARNAGVRNLAAGRLRFHDLRHSFASWMLAEGGDLKVVQEALGHAQIRTTMRYAHLRPGAREAVTRAVADGLTTPRKERMTG